MYYILLWFGIVALLVVIAWLTQELKTLRHVLQNAVDPRPRPRHPAPASKKKDDDALNLP